MSDLRYALIVTTDGRGTLDRTLEAFDRRVRPRPSEVVIVDDSGDAGYRLYLEALVNARGPGWRALFHRERRGFCRCVASAWEQAAHADSPYVLWLEDDFEFVRSVDLSDLAHVLEREPQVAQMAFYRQPVNDEEIAASGYLNQRRDTYQLRGAGSGRTWFEHRNHWTTNPSLFRRSIPEHHPWPGFTSSCEGHFGFILRGARPRTTFGLWGAGDVWVRHFGERSDGRGY